MVAIWELAKRFGTSAPGAPKQRENVAAGEKASGISERNSLCPRPYRAARRSRKPILRGAAAHFEPVAARNECCDSMARDSDRLAIAGGKFIVQRCAMDGAHEHASGAELPVCHHEFHRQPGDVLQVVKITCQRIQRIRSPPQNVSSEAYPDRLKAELQTAPAPNA